MPVIRPSAHDRVFRRLCFFAMIVCFGLAFAADDPGGPPAANETYLCEHGVINSPGGKLAYQRANWCKGCCYIDDPPTNNPKDGICHVEKGAQSKTVTIYRDKYEYAIYIGGGCNIDVSQWLPCDGFAVTFPIDTSVVSAGPIYYRLIQAQPIGPSCSGIFPEFRQSRLSSEQLQAWGRVAVVGPTEWRHPTTIPRKDGDAAVNVGVTIGPAEANLYQPPSGQPKPVRLRIWDPACPSHERWFYAESLAVNESWDGKLYVYPSPSPTVPVSDAFYCQSSDVFMSVSAQFADRVVAEDLKSLTDQVVDYSFTEKRLAVSAIVSPDFWCLPVSYGETMPVGICMRYTAITSDGGDASQTQWAGGDQPETGTGSSFEALLYRNGQKAITASLAGYAAGSFLVDLRKPEISVVTAFKGPAKLVNAPPPRPPCFLGVEIRVSWTITPPENGAGLVRLTQLVKQDRTSWFDNGTVRCLDARDEWHLDADNYGGCVYGGSSYSQFAVPELVATRCPSSGDIVDYPGIELKDDLSRVTAKDEFEDYVVYTPELGCGCVAIYKFSWSYEWNYQQSEPGCDKWTKVATEPAALLGSSDPASLFGCSCEGIPLKHGGGDPCNP